MYIVLFPPLFCHLNVIALFSVINWNNSLIAGSCTGIGTVTCLDAVDGADVVFT